MKKIYYFLPVMFAMLFTACDDWLTVEPSDMVTVDKALNEREGYIAALTGVYQILETTYNPGGFLMGSGLDEIANIYSPIPTGFSPSLYSAYNHDYQNTNFDNASGASFLGMYRALANINVLLENLETTEVLTEQDHALMEGEAKALRALLQFDLWRVYGPVPGTELVGEPVLPYMLDATTDFLPYSDYQAYFIQLREDLEDARTLLAESDPIMVYSNPYLNAPGSIAELEDISYYYRQNRMNYYAAVGLSARVELWTRNYEAAYQFAKEVIDARNQDGSPKFVLGNITNIQEGDFAFSTEHLFGVTTTDYDDDAYSGQNAQCVVSENMFLDGDFIFPGGESSDIRSTLFVTLDANTVAGEHARGSSKYSNMSQNDPGEKNFPVIRLAEMYLILAEAGSGQSEADTYFMTYLNSRNAEEADTYLEEYIREFYAEGQAFYAYKRTNADQLEISGVMMTPEAYRLPLPTGETTSNL